MEFFDFETATISLYKYHRFLDEERFMDELKKLIEYDISGHNPIVSVDSMIAVFCRMRRELWGGGMIEPTFYGGDKLSA